MAPKSSKRTPRLETWSDPRYCEQLKNQIFTIVVACNENNMAAMSSVKIRCRQLSSNMLQLALSHCCLDGREVRSQTSLSHRKTQWQPRGCPTDHTRCRTRETGDSETTQHTAVSQFGSKRSYTTIDEQEQYRTTDRCSSPFPRVQSCIKVSRSHTF